MSRVALHTSILSDENETKYKALIYTIDFVGERFKIFVLLKVNNLSPLVSLYQIQCY